MRKNLEKASTRERFDHLISLLSSQRFLNREGLGNEVPFFVCPFAPAEAIEFAEVVSQLKRQLAQSGIRILDINLFDLAIEMLDKDGDLKWILDEESKHEKVKILNHLRGVLDTEKHLTSAIEQKMKDTAGFQILFMTGIGEVFPYIRSHNVLNNLQRIAKEQPTVLFFPGTYSHSLEKGASLELFGRLRDDKYYRAYNVFDREV